MIKVVHYINQFFAQIGGEEMAHVKPEVREGIGFGSGGPGTGGIGSIDIGPFFII